MGKYCEMIQAQMINETPYNVKFIRAKKIEDGMSMKAT